MTYLSHGATAALTFRGSGAVEGHHSLWTLFLRDMFVLISGPPTVWVKACGCLSVRALWCHP